MPTLGQTTDAPQLFFSTSLTRELVVTITGSAPAYSFVEIYRNDLSLGYAYSDDKGRFSLTTYLDEGINSFRARTLRDDGTFSEFSTPLFITYDLVPPEPPVPDSRNLLIEPTQYLYGSAESDSVVVILVDGQVVAQVPVSNAGRFETGNLDLTPGWHDILYYAVDGAGQKSLYSALVTVYVQAFPEEYAWALKELGTQGIMRGYPDGTIRPLNRVTRAEFTCILTRAMEKIKSNLTPQLEKASFSDLPTTHWAFAAAEWAAANGWMNGFPDGLFHPEAYVTGKEVIAAIVRAAGLEREAQAAQSLLKDAPWYSGYSVVGAQHGLLYPDFAPDEEALRGQVALSLYALLSLPTAQGVSR